VFEKTDDVGGIEAATRPTWRDLRGRTRIGETHYYNQSLRIRGDRPTLQYARQSGEFRSPQSQNPPNRPSPLAVLRRRMCYRRRSLQPRPRLSEDPSTTPCGREIAARRVS
jgi:hypothetical protein